MVRLINYLIYSNVYIAICAVSLTVQTSYILGLSIDHYILLLVFFATLLVYALHRIGFSIDYLEQNDRFNYLKGIRKHLIAICFISIVICFYIYLDVFGDKYWVAVIPFLISMGYVIPCLPSKNGLIRLRDIHYVKIFLVALIWMFVTVYLPYINEDRIPNSSFWIHVLDRCIFIFAITLPFDIRDMDQEDKANVYTFVSLMGIEKAKMLSIVSMVIWLGLACHQFQSYSWVFGYGLTSVVVVYLVVTSNEKKKDHHYSLLLDGTMLINLPFFMFG